MLILRVFEFVLYAMHFLLNGVDLAIRSSLLHQKFTGQRFGAFLGDFWSKKQGKMSKSEGLEVLVVSSNYFGDSICSVTTPQPWRVNFS